MPFVKLDTGILNSTLWVERECRDIFITALLMAEPFETLIPMQQICVNSLDLTGWQVPPGWYGFVAAAGPGIIRRAIVEQDVGLLALERLGNPDPASRSTVYEGRRMVRVDGGYIILNFITYREKDATTADRSKRWRERQRMKGDQSALSNGRHAVTDTPTRVIRHQAEAEAEADKESKTLFADANGAWSEFWKAYPRKTAKQTALKAWRKVKATEIPAVMAALETHKTSEQWLRGVIPHPATWIHQRRWEDETVSTLDDLGQCMWNKDGSRDPDKARCTGRGVEDDRGVIYCTKHQHLHRRH